MVAATIRVELAIGARRPNLRPPTTDDTLAVARLLDNGNVLVALTPGQLDLAVEALGTHAGRLADEPLAPSDAYVPFAALQSYLARFQQEAPR